MAHAANLLLQIALHEGTPSPLCSLGGVGLFVELAKKVSTHALLPALSAKNADKGGTPTEQVPSQSHRCATGTPSRRLPSAQAYKSADSKMIAIAHITSPVTSPLRRRCLLARHVEVDQVGLEAAGFPSAVGYAGGHPNRACDFGHRGEVPPGARPCWPMVWNLECQNRLDVFQSPAQLINRRSRT